MELKLCHTSVRAFDCLVSVSSSSFRLQLGSVQTSHWHEWATELYRHQNCIFAENQPVFTWTSCFGQSSRAKGACMNLGWSKRVTWRGTGVSRPGSKAPQCCKNIHRSLFLLSTCTCMNPITFALPVACDSVMQQNNKCMHKFTWD